MELNRNDLKKQRVCLVANVGTNTLQLISTTMLVRAYDKTPGGARLYEGPTYAAFENIRHAYRDTFKGMSLVGALVAEPSGEFRGHIDWVQPTDGGVIAELRARATGADKEPAPKEPTHLTADSPLVLDLLLDPQLNRELQHTTGGADSIACILNAASRLMAR